VVKVVIIDYGIGNVKSLKRSLVKVGADVEISADKSVLNGADALVLPGVGAFEPAITRLLPIIPDVMEQTNQGKPMLGICLGLQLMFTQSEEKGIFQGLDIINGNVIHFPEMKLKVPHIGWNSLQIKDENHPLYLDIPQESYVYFVHSYYGDAKIPEQILTTTNYGIDFPSSVGKDNIFATQFHPEKSGEVGLKMLTNFINYAKK
jgi:imidazole glycerol-phosphate synthase subunit HisH